MNIKAFLIDDEEHALEVLHIYIKQTPGITATGIFTNPLNALTELPNAAPDMLFLDIDMPEMNGLDMVTLIPPQIQVVFTTSYREYGPEAYNASAADYLLKPIRYERFLKCIQKVGTLRVNTNNTLVLPGAGYFFVKTGNKGRLEKVIPDEVIYVEAAQNYVHIVTIAGKIVTYMSMSEIKNRLATGFLQVHKSFIINLSRVRGFEKAVILMNDHSAIPLGRTFREVFFEAVPGIGDC